MNEATHTKLVAILKTAKNAAGEGESKMRDMMQEADTVSRYLESLIWDMANELDLLREMKADCDKAWRDMANELDLRDDQMMKWHLLDQTFPRQ